ncbi:hypothetical protein JOQ06_007765 [Pogonophryne albipinna]|uniref:Endonuclease/exonuclease/phosphatase domain-containing protein n=1 Tax=Pogonophryne albipinna TaxID=1090488 RepID=A0AAD6B3I9_9TELE|nr:hypothetical protein JOQ06_007765 [Pogonophryne albipinna]
MEGSPLRGQKQKIKEKHLRIGAWNVRTLTDNQASDRPERRTAIISRELGKFQIDIAALSETRLADEGQLKEEKGRYTFFWKGKPANEPRIHGVGFAIKNCLINHLHELPVGINERLMTIRLMLASSQMATVISAYAPTLDAQDEVKEAFYANLDKTLSEVPKEDKLILLGDFNARVGRNHHLWRGNAGERRGWKHKLQWHTTANQVLRAQPGHHQHTFPSKNQVQNIMDASSLQTMASH